MDIHPSFSAIHLLSDHTLNIPSGSIVPLETGIESRSSFRLCLPWLLPVYMFFLLGWFCWNPDISYTSYYKYDNLETYTKNWPPTWLTGMPQPRISIQIFNKYTRLLSICYREMENMMWDSRTSFCAESDLYLIFYLVWWLYLIWTLFFPISQ